MTIANLWVTKAQKSTFLCNSQNVSTFASQFKTKV